MHIHHVHTLTISQLQATSTGKREKKMERKIHVVMLPWSAFGHIMPCFQLSISLAKAGVHVSFVSTPKNIQRLPKIPPDISSLINLVELPLPTLMDPSLLPEGAEATVDIPSEKIQYLMMAFNLLEKPFNQFIREQSPDYIIVDICTQWTIPIAKEHNVPLIYFSAFSAAGLAFFGKPDSLFGDGAKKFWPSSESLTSPPEWIRPLSSSMAYRSYEAIGLYNGFFGENNASGGITHAHCFAKILDSCQVVAVRSCTEFESEYLNLQAKILGKPVIPVGLLPPEPSRDREFTHQISSIKLFKWLDEQQPKSVVFVGFGSECKLSKEQVYEIAHGVELSQLPFLWALRKPDWAIDDLDALPPGFGHRTSGKGVVHIGWAPQMEILAHPSIGGSLFHSGWGSLIETLQFGHCLVVLPFISDQCLNARLMVEKGLAIEVERTEDGSYSGTDIAKALRHAMVSKEGEGLRNRARETAAIFGDRKLHDHYIMEFVEYLKNGVSK